MVIVVVQGSALGVTQSDPIALKNMERCIELAKASGATEVAIASSGQIQPLPDITVISYSERYPLGSAIAEFTRSRKDHHVVVVPAEISSLSEAAAAMRQLMTSQAGFTFVSTLQGSMPVDFPGMGESGLLPTQLMQELQPDMTVPALGMSVERGLLSEAKFSTQSLAGMALELVIEAYHRGDLIQATEIELSVPSNFAPLSMPQGDIARNLRRAIEMIPIEELFPSYPWTTRQSESAASCYHTLAARFIRLNDFSSAESCLTQADQLQDSPRALTMRAVIAMERGETLGAIAKLIASLQEYEQRKRNGATDSSSSGFECVNDELKAGLHALNSQDNPTALKHFARAVREFDSFYRDSGLLLLV